MHYTVLYLYTITNTFKSIQTKRVFNIYHTITCKSQWIIQYVGKSETSFNIGPKATQVCVHFRKEGHNFIQHTKFTLTQQVTETEMLAKQL